MNLNTVADQLIEQGQFELENEIINNPIKVELYEKDGLKLTVRVNSDTDKVWSIELMDIGSM